MQRLITICAVVGLIMAVSGMAHASLMGDDVDVSFATTQIFTVTVASGPELVEHGLGAGGGPAVSRWTIDIEAATIRVDFTSGGGASYGPGAFLLFGDLDPTFAGGPGFISNVTLLDANTPTLFSPAALAASLTFGDHFVKVPIAPTQVVTWDEGQFFLLGLEFIPEPTTVVLLGLGGLGMLRRRKRA